jgi:hypothetical protein
MDYKAIDIKLGSCFAIIDEHLKDEVQHLNTLDTEQADDLADYLNNFRRELIDISNELEWYLNYRMEGRLP